MLVSSDWLELLACLAGLGGWVNLSWHRDKASTSVYKLVIRLFRSRVVDQTHHL